MRPDVRTDAALSRLLGVSRQAIGHYRLGGNMNVYVAVQAARILEIDPMETISAAMHAQAKTDTEAEFWKAEYIKALTTNNTRTVPPPRAAQPEQANDPHPRRRGRFD